MAILHVVGKAAVMQQEIEALLGLQNQLREFRRIHDQLCANILDRLLSGAEVEQGIHTAEVSQVSRGSKRITRLVLHLIPILGFVTLMSARAAELAG